MSCRSVRHRFSAHRDRRLRGRRGAGRRRAPRRLCRLRGAHWRSLDDDARRCSPRCRRLECTGEHRAARLRPPGHGEPPAGAGPALPSLRRRPALDAAEPRTGGVRAGGRAQRRARARPEPPPPVAQRGSSAPGRLWTRSVPPSGHGAQPAFAYGEVSTPRMRPGTAVPRYLLDHHGRGHALPGNRGGARRHRLRGAPDRRRFRASAPGRARSAAPGALRARPVPRPPGGGEHLPADQPHGGAGGRNQCRRRPLWWMRPPTPFGATPCAPRRSECGAPLLALRSGRAALPAICRYSLMTGRPGHSLSSANRVDRFLLTPSSTSRAARSTPSSPGCPSSRPSRAGL